MREHFINADFDLSLRRRRTPGSSDARTRQAGELPMHLLLLGTGGDSILAPNAVDEPFLDYLSNLGLPLPSVRVLPAISESATFSPFGWNDEACGLNDRYLNPSGHPPLDVVRRVNGRLFATGLENRHFGGRHTVGVIRSVQELVSLLEDRPAGENGWLVKAEHGNGAFGNRRLRTRTLGPADRETVARLLQEDESAVVEVWRPRLVDLASVFVVDEDGGLRDHCIYEVVNTADGALIGDIFDHDSAGVHRWGGELETAMSRVARELATAGYSGPVCVDSFVWNDGGTERLRSVVDINARLSVSAAAERLWRMWGCDRVVYWRLFTARKLRLPETPAGVAEALGDDAFEPHSRLGVLLTSPTVVNGRRPRRLGVLLAGAGRASVDRLDRRFRERFER